MRMTKEEIVKILSNAAGVTLTGGLSVVNPVVYTQQERGKLIILADDLTSQQTNKFYITKINMKHSFNSDAYLNFGSYMQGLSELNLTIEATSTGPVDVTKLQQFFDKRVLYL